MPSEVSKLSFLHVLESIVLVIASLYWARAVFVPLALALMLTFLLQPIVAALHRRGLGYTYDILREQVFPWTLPFDLWSATARAYLGHLGIQRHDLMRAFQRPGAPPESPSPANGWA